MSRLRFGPFPYQARAAAAHAAHQELHAAFRKVRRRDDPDDPDTAAWHSAIERFRTAIASAYPPDFWDDFALLQKGDPDGVETAIRFLEADPYFDRSGYVKADLLRLLKKTALRDADIRRLRAVVVDAAERRGGREFRAYCRLARRLDGPELRACLGHLASTGAPDVRRRAAWMLESLGQAGGRFGTERKPER